MLSKNETFQPGALSQLLVVFSILQTAGYITDVNRICIYSIRFLPTCETPLQASKFLNGTFQ